MMFFTQQHIDRTFKPVLLATVVGVASLLAACSKHDDQTAGEKLDSAVAQVEQKADDAKQSIDQSADKAKAETEAAADSASDKLNHAGDKVANAVSDATITASVNGELAKDPELSALKINVDTDHGHVVLKGEAPNMKAKDRATVLASSVKGVTGVDNRLDVQG
jgi:hyperosmotically inducible periplasmic protein